MKNTTGIKSPKWALAVGAIVLIAALGLRLHQYWQDRREVAVEVTVGAAKYVAEVADTDRKKELGLGERDSLAVGTAMYFPMSSTEFWVFWMKGMRFPIDIVWISEGKIVDISRRAPAPRSGEEPATFSPASPADAILEVNAGEAEKYGWKRGDEVMIKAKS